MAARDPDPRAALITVLVPAPARCAGGSAYVSLKTVPEGGAGRSRESVLPGLRPLAGRASARTSCHRGRLGQRPPAQRRGDPRAGDKPCKSRARRRDRPRFSQPICSRYCSRLYALADTDGADDGHIGALLDEAHRDELVEQLLVEGHGGGVVPALELHLWIEVRTLSAQRRSETFSTRGLVLQHEQAKT